MSIDESIGDDFAGHPHPTQGFSRYSLAAAGLALVLLYVGLLLLGASQGRGHARRLQCASNLRQVGLALQGYLNWRGCLPPPYTVDATGKPMRSWRSLILPFLANQGELDDYRFDESWDGPNNRKFGHVGENHYRCPDRLSNQPDLTDFVVIRGPGTAFPGGKRVSLTDVKDDPSTTILAVEFVDSGIHWAEHRDLDIDSMSFKINNPSRPGISSHHQGGAHVLMMDGSVRFLRDDLSPAMVRALITIDGGEAIN
jgi:prepilin-type processing-associated H-X9-DG protein